ncbi:urea ABC transporter permease subunit UrtC [Hydrogenibacillus schlegelii]|uniref:Urea ABC transporter permease subunit UrtC n=1 Tax=Hydrogenibacillus schlegelii TaxID=1484 RepID=A0A179INZ9_HYDSH|nr:urea ABC transporter permease subunit UrtC [Hydrogenibacillus schlegelii]OAR04398.1 urea ABC transporter permease subunit UrtC [Hydrogenibacillus schlegelii]
MTARAPGSRLAGWLPFAGAALLLLVVAPLVLSDFRLNLLGKFLCFAILALGLDLVWGYTGMLSLGQGVFFGLGGYAMAMYLKLEASQGELPDFMSWSGLSALPWFWKPFAHAWFAIPMAILIPGALAGAVGYLLTRSRIRGAYFSLITQALALIFTILFIGQQPYTGGTNGITNLTTLFGFSLGDPRTQKVLYLITAVTLGVTYLLLRRVTASRFGRLLIAIRDGENRVRFCGYNPVAVKALAFAVGGALAGLAGALFVPQVGIISPAMMGVVPSIEMVVWVALGGRGTLTGAVLGALLVNLAKTYLSESFPGAWTFGLGLLFVLVVVYLPDGLVGLVRRVGLMGKSGEEGLA